MNKVTQFSTMGALVGGRFEGAFPIKNIIESGDHGIGTLEGLNGELIILEGKPYVIESTGLVREVSKDEMSPYASVMDFQPTKTFNLKGSYNKSQLDEIMTKEINGENHFHGAKITGKFKVINARSAKKQQQPYPKLVDAVKEQGYFDFESTEGTLFGFYTPHFIQGIGVGGYHVHFLSHDLKKGGHVFDYEIEDVKVELALQQDFLMKMPNTDEYFSTDLNDPEMLQDIEASE